jgi:hypothetical protein
VRFVWFVLAPGFGRWDSDLPSRHGLRLVERKRFRKMEVWLYAVPEAGDG